MNTKLQEQKVNEALKDIYDSLTDEQKEKAKACKTTEELMAFVAKEGFELPDEALEAVAGGEPLFDACRDKEGCGSYNIFDYMC